MKIIIVGATQSGKTLVNSLSQDKHDITIIESDEKLAKDLAKKVDALVITGESTDLVILRDAKIEEADALIAATNDDKTNLMVCEIAKSENIAKIISIVNNVGDEELFTKLGITTIIPVVELVVTQVKRALYAKHGVSILASIGGGSVEVLEISVNEKSHLIGKKATIEGVVVGAIYRAGKLMIADPNAIVNEGDVLLIITESKNRDGIVKLVSGK